MSITAEAAIEPSVAEGVLRVPHSYVNWYLLDDAERDTIITGDALVTFDPYTTLTGPRLVAKAALADSRQNLASLDRIADSGASHLLPGHGDPWHGRAEDAVEQARRNGTR